MNTDNLIECANYEGEESGLYITVYKSSDNKQFIKKCIYKGRTLFLKIGQTKDEVFYNNYPYFPFVFFHVREAKKYGLEDSCTGQYVFDGQFRNLTCDPDQMHKFDEQMLEQTADSHRKMYKAKCPNCGTLWRVTEVSQDRFYMYYDKINQYE